MKPLYRFALLAGVVIFMAPLSACTMNGEYRNNPLPSLTAQFPQPFFVNVSSIIVDTKYDPLQDTKDVASTFPTPPDIALKSYAENRFRPAGGPDSGVLHIVIEDASVFQEDLRSPSEMARLIGVDNKDKYKMVIRLNLYVDGAGYGSPGAMGTKMKAERTLTIPDGVSLDERDGHLQSFMVKVLADIDSAVTGAMKDTLLIASDDVAPSPGPYPVDPVETTDHTPEVTTVPIPLQ